MYKRFSASRTSHRSRSTNNATKHNKHTSNLHKCMCNFFYNIQSFFYKSLALAVCSFFTKIYVRTFYTTHLVSRRDSTICLFPIPTAARFHLHTWQTNMKTNNTEQKLCVWICQKKKLCKRPEWLHSLYSCSCY